MFKTFGTRQRVITSAIVIGILSFLLISPTAKTIYEYIMPPAQVQNISISKTSIGEITLNWDQGVEYDLKGYKITKDGEEVNAPFNVDNFKISGLDQLRNYTFSIASFDDSNRVSITTQFRYSDINDTLLINQNIQQPFVLILIFRSLILFIALFFLTSWALFYKFSRKNIFNIVFLPSFLLIPYLLLSITTVETISSSLNKLLISGVLTLVIVVISYISLLTTNILNAAAVSKLPLEQAGKATQFILSLISTYLILIYAFGSYQNVIFRLAVLIPFIFIYTYTGIRINKNNNYLSNIKTTGITLLVALSVMVASVWPVEVAYSILMIAVIYYILLNLALEVRTRYTRALWVEYCTLILLVLLLFLSTSNWGIGFSII